LIENNPVKFVKMCEENNVRDRVLSKEGFERLLSCVPDFIGDILLVAYFTAMRVGEILNLRWSSVDLKAGLIRRKPEDTKTKEGRSFLISHLTDVFDRCIRHLHHDYVFTHNHKSIKYSTLRYHFQRAVEKAGSDAPRAQRGASRSLNLIIYELCRFIPAYKAGLSRHLPVKTLLLMIFVIPA
jgi:integrase